MKRQSSINCLLFLLACCLVCGAPLQAQSLREAVEQANRLYEAGDYQQALERYQLGAADITPDPTVLYNRANCYYHLDDLDEAINLYRQAAADTRDMTLVARARYNLGNCYYQRGLKNRDSDLNKTLESLTTSVQYYRQTLDIDSEDADAKHNIAVVRLLMKDIIDQNKREKEKQEQQQKQL